MRSRRSSLVETQFYQHENHQFNTKSQLRAERFAPNALLLFIMSVVMISGVWMVNHQNAGAFCNSLLEWNVICFWSIVIAHALHPESYSTRYKVVSSHSTRDERHTHTQTMAEATTHNSRITNKNPRKTFICYSIYIHLYHHRKMSLLDRSKNGRISSPRISTPP